MNGRLRDTYRRLRRPSRLSRRLLAAAGWSSVLQLISRAQGAVLLAVAARLLTAPELGTFFAIQAIGILGASSWDLGSTVLITRDVAAGTARARPMIAAALRQRAVTAPAFVVVVGLLCLWLSGPTGFGVGTVLLILAAPTVVGIGTIYNSVLMGRQEFSASATAVTSGRVLSVALMAALVPIGVRGQTAVVLLATALLLGEVLTYLLQWRSEIRGSRPAETQPGAPDEAVPLGRFIRSSLPHAANSFFNYAYQKGDILLVTALAGVVVTAHYAPASQLQNILALFPTLLAAGIVPVVSADRGAEAGGQLADRVARRMAQFGVVIALPVCLVASLCMPFVIRIVLGRPDEAAVVPAMIVVWALPFLCVHTPLALALIARGLAAQATKAYAVAFVGSLALHVALVPTFGAVGGAVASGTRDVLMAACLLVITRRVARSDREAVAGVR